MTVSAAVPGRVRSACWAMPAKRSSRTCLPLRASSPSHPLMKVSECRCSMRWRPGSPYSPRIARPAEVAGDAALLVDPLDGEAIAGRTSPAGLGSYVLGGVAAARATPCRGVHLGKLGRKDLGGLQDPGRDLAAFLVIAIFNARRNFWSCEVSLILPVTRPREAGLPRRAGEDSSSSSAPSSRLLNPMVASNTRNTSYPARLISPIASAMRSESDSDSLIALPSSCIRSFSRSSICPFLGPVQGKTPCLVDAHSPSCVPPAL